MKKHDYEVVVKLNHNETPHKLNMETGELIEVKSRRNNIPEGKELFEPNAKFVKCYYNTWQFMSRYLSSSELGIVIAMVTMADANNCSLKPLDDKTTVAELMDYFDISEKKVKSTFDKLHRLGVYGRFDVSEENKPYTKYWILNPYIAFNGKIIESDISRLFTGTSVFKGYHNPLHTVPEFQLLKQKSVRAKRNDKRLK
jgi:hypothetical protein